MDVPLFYHIKTSLRLPCCVYRAVDLGVWFFFHSFFYACIITTTIWECDNFSFILSISNAESLLFVVFKWEWHNTFSGAHFLSKNWFLRSMIIISNLKFEVRLQISGDLKTWPNERNLQFISFIQGKKHTHSLNNKITS